METDRKGRYPPNRRLAWHRLQLGWSREELVRQIEASIKAHGENVSGLTADTARRWESGERWPEPRFRKHLVLLFGVPASELGLLTPEELAQAPDDVTTGTVGLSLDGLLAPREGAVLGRQRFLRALLVSGLAPVAATNTVSAADAAWQETSSTRDPQSVIAYQTIAQTQSQLYWSTPPDALFNAASSHLRLGIHMLAASPANLNHGHDLARAVAESALLSARLAFFDLGAPYLAEQCLDHADSAVRECDDHALATAIAAHRAFIPAFVGDPVSAHRNIDVARAHARYARGPRLRAWLQCVAAEVNARAGEHRTTRECIRRSQDALGAEGTDPEWLDFFDAARMAGFAGNAELLAGRSESATGWLHAALDQLGRQEAKQRAVLLADLSAAYGPSNPSHSAALAHQACDVLESTFYRTAHDRISTVCRSLSAKKVDPSLQERSDALCRRTQAQ